MTSDEALAVFKRAGALLEGHFVLSSGLHSPFFIQKARLFEDPAATETVCRALAEKARAAWGPIHVVVGPAVGGIIPAYETARALGARAMFVEREDGAFRLRRGFFIGAQERVIVIEDIVTTGGSAREAIEALRAEGVEPVGAACLVDRSGGKADVGAPLLSLAQADFPTYEPGSLPPDLAALPAVKPGSRHLAG